MFAQSQVLDIDLHWWRRLGALFATLSGSWFWILVVDCPFWSFLFLFEENGARSTRPKRVWSVPKPRVEIREQRHTRWDRSLDQGDELQLWRHRCHGDEVRRVQFADQRAWRHLRYRQYTRYDQASHSCGKSASSQHSLSWKRDDSSTRQLQTRSSSSITAPELSKVGRETWTGQRLRSRSNSTCLTWRVHCCRRASCENTGTQSCWTNSRQSRKTAPRSRWQTRTGCRHWLELRLASRAGEVDGKMCAPVEEIGEEARRATPMYVRKGPSDAERRAQEIHHMPCRSWCEFCVRGRGKESPHLSRYEQADDGIPVVQVDYAFLHDTGDKEAKVTFLTMVDNSSGQMVATAVQKKGHDKFVQRFLLKGVEPFGVTGETVLHVAAERKATTIIRETPIKAHTRLSATDNITSWMIRHAAFLQNTFLCRKGRQNTIHETTSQRLHEPTCTIWIRGNRTQLIRFPIRSRHLACKSHRERWAHCRNNTGCLHSKVGSTKNDQEIWNSRLIKSMKGTPRAPWREDSKGEVGMPEERHRPMTGWNTNTRVLRDFWDEMGTTAGCAACASPGGKKHNVACLNRQEEWKNTTTPRRERATRETDAEMQLDTQAPEDSSSAHTQATGIGDTTVRHQRHWTTRKCQRRTWESRRLDSRETNSIEIKTSCAERQISNT